MVLPSISHRSGRSRSALLQAAALAVLACGPLAAQQPASSADQPQKLPARIQSPFQEDEDMLALERAREEAKLKVEKDEQKALELREENRKVALRAALAPIKVLARGLQGNRAVVLLAVDSNRRIMLAKDETIVLTTATGAVELRLRSVTRQTLSFELEDGTILPLQ